MRDHGARYLRKMSSNHCGLMSLRREKRISNAAARGLPRNTATDVAMTW